jgi:hypothetical protein
MIENICKLVKDNSTVTDKNGVLIWQKNKYLETLVYATIKCRSNIFHHSNYNGRIYK